MSQPIIQPGGPQSTNKLHQDQLKQLAQRLHLEVMVMKVRLMEMHNLTLANGRQPEAADKDSFLLAIAFVQALQKDLQEVIGQGPIVVAGSIPKIGD